MSHTGWSCRLASTHRRRNAADLQLSRRNRAAVVSTPLAPWNFDGAEISSSRRLAAGLWHNRFDGISACESLNAAAEEAIVNHARRRVNEVEAKNQSLRRKVNRLREKLQYERCCECHVAAAVNARMARRWAAERRGRVEAEAACAELLRRVSSGKKEADSLRMDYAELAEEHRAVQLAEAWREERVQMKLADARLALDDGFAKINFLVSELHALAVSGDLTAVRELLQSAMEAFGADYEDETHKDEDEVCGLSAEWESEPDANRDRRHNVSPASAVVADDRKVRSPEKWRTSENPHIARGMRGCVEWPRARAVSKSVVKAKILNLNQRLNSRKEHD